MSVESANAVVAVVAARTPIQIVLALRDLDCTVSLVEGGDAALDKLAEHPADVIVIEHDPLGLDGLALTDGLRRIERHLRTPVLLVAEGDGRTVRRAALEAGASDVMLKPLDTLDLQIRLRTFIELAAARLESERSLRAMNHSVERAVAEAAAREREIIRRLMLAAEFRDDQAGDHLTRVAGCVIAIAEALGVPESQANDIALASTMHDIGKIGVPDDILLKPGPLTDDERHEMQRHAQRGFRMLDGSSSRLLKLASQIALTHHERWDGQGYPQGLAGEAIPLPGRIVAVADVFDALTSARVYKPAWPLERARRHIEENAGTHFDPACVSAFLARWDDIAALMEERADSASRAA